MQLLKSRKTNPKKRSDCMKWNKIIPPIALILAGIVTMSMKVITAVNSHYLYIMTKSIDAQNSYQDGTIFWDGEPRTVFTYSPLVYVIGGLLIVAGGVMLYNEIKEAQNAN